MNGSGNKNEKTITEKTIQIIRAHGYRSRTRSEAGNNAFLPDETPKESRRKEVYREELSSFGTNSCVAIGAVSVGYMQFTEREKKLISLIPALRL